MKKILVSFLLTKYSLMKRHWENASALKSKGITGTNKPIGKSVNLGGIFVEIDWNKKKINKGEKLSCPSGFDFLDDKIVVASMRKNEIYFLNNNLNLLKKISNKLFNDIHHIFITSKKTIFVASTGLDAVVEIDTDGNTIWEWFASEHGYPCDQFGKKRYIDKSIDHRLIDYPTLYQSTHLNSAIQCPRENNIIYVSLFHQGEIIKINKNNGRTKVIYSDLKNCHSLQIFNQNFYIADTRGKRIIFFNKNFKIKKILKLNINWIQDVCLTTWGTILVADADKNKILEIDFQNNNLISELNYPKEWRIYQMREVIKKDG